MSDLHYPIGEFQRQPGYNSEEKRKNIELFREVPSSLRAAVAGLSAQQLDTPYRDGGWTLRQVTHHLPDSHLNAYTRIKLALTEDNPVIKPYDEAAWALLADTKQTPLEISIALLEAIHTRLIAIFEALNENQWKRDYLHPVNGVTSIETTLASYVWHGQHHIAHITNLRQRRGW
ncbi:MAG: YfiT family bacillithiol transferase [Trueperaceae bacterium]